MRNEYVNVWGPNGKSIGMTNEWQRVPDTADYIIFKKGDKAVAKNGNTGAIVYGDTDIAKVVQYVYDNHDSKFITIYIKSGVYDAYTDITFDVSVRAFALYGDTQAWGWYSTEIEGTLINFHNSTGIKITSSGGQNTNFAIEGLSLNGIDKTGIGIKIGDKDSGVKLAYFNITNTTLRNFDTGLYIYGLSYKLDNVQASDNNTGMWLSTSAGAGWVSLFHCSANSNTNYGIYTELIRALNISSCDVESNGIGIYTDAARGVDIINLWTEGNTTADIITNGGSAINILGGNINGKIQIGDSDTTASVRILGVVHESNKNTISFDIVKGEDVILDLSFYDTSVSVSGDLTYTTLLRGNWSYHTHFIDGMGLKIGRLVIPTSAPSSPQAGDMYFDTSAGKLYIYDGSAWRSVALS